MARIRRQDIFFYVAMALLFTLVGLGLWRRVKPPGPETLRVVQIVQIAIIPVLIALFLLSLRQPLSRWNKSLVDERQALARQKRRKKSRRH